ncbi:MAG: glycoside hydrolase family 5 protein [Bacillota bacterium]
MSRCTNRAAWCGVLVSWVMTIVVAPWAAWGADTNATEAFEQNKRLGRGVNVIGYDPLWRDRSRARFQAEYFQMIRQAGFDHVRINLHPYRDGKPDANHKISETYLKTLDWAVEQALASKLRVILDFHEFTAMAKDPLSKKERFLAMWGQIAERCKGLPSEVYFEVLNEPNGELTPAMWNQFLSEALELIRKTNPTRTVIIGPAFWNGIGHLGELQLPENDRNIIVTIHYYSPMEFTHQGAAWTSQRDKLGVAWNGTEQERAAVARDFDKAQSWAEQQRRPLYLGEFGAYDKAEMASRVRYISYVAREAEKRGWSWGYWQFDGDFILYDIPKKQWIEPIRKALIPG